MLIINNLTIKLLILVSVLGSPKFKEREKAQKELNKIAMKEEIIDFLFAVKYNHRSAEVRFRMKEAISSYIAGLEPNRWPRIFYLSSIAENERLYRMAFESIPDVQNYQRMPGTQVDYYLERAKLERMASKYYAYLAIMSGKKRKDVLDELNRALILE